MVRSQRIACPVSQRISRIFIYSLGKDTKGYGTFQNVSGEKGHFFFSWKRDILPSALGRIFSSGNLTTYPLGFGLLILWESYYLSSGIRDILWETGHEKRNTLSSGIRTTYPLGIVPIILWDNPYITLLV